MPQVSIEWLRDHVRLPEEYDVEQLAADLVKVGLEEEEIHPPAVSGPLTVGKVLTLVKEPQKNGKTINYCRVDVGPQHNDAPGEGKEVADVASRGIVCGAHNFKVGDHVVVSLPGTTLPGGFEISARKTYGHISDGMICSARELGISDEHEGIIVLEEYLGADADIPAPGTDAKQLLGLGESTLEINVTPDRGYCFAMRGIARELSHSIGAHFTDPGLAENLPTAPPQPTADGFAVEVDDRAPIHDQVGCDRFVTRIVRGIDPAAPTPKWMADRLIAAGMRPLSLAVDITNYVMLDLGQPLHAYDLAKMAAPIVVRRARAGEKLTTLDDVERALGEEDLLITDSPAGERASRVLGLAGVMGGAETEISPSTTDVLIEAAHFDPVSIARTARNHKLPSEAAKRFERGVDPLLPPVAAQRCVDLLCQYGGGTADDAVTDNCAITAPAPIDFPVALASAVIGKEYSGERCRQILSEIGCDIAGDASDTLRVTSPSWRPDLTVPADLVEEIARIDGYDSIPESAPVMAPGRGLTRAQRARRAVAQTLADIGWTEVLTYPFIGTVHDTFGYADDDQRRRVVKLANPLADDAPYLRTSLLDSLVSAARRNVSRGLDSVAIYEMGMVTRPRGSEVQVPIPPAGARPSDAELSALADNAYPQPRHVAGIAVGPRAGQSPLGKVRAWDWADAIADARRAASAIGVTLTITQAERAPWHPGRCAALSVGEQIIGYAGELHPQVLTKLELPARTIAFELDLDALVAAGHEGALPIRPVSTFPALKEDFAFVVDDAVPASALVELIREVTGELGEDVRIFDVFTGEQIGEGKKSVAVAVRLRAADHTLTAEEAGAMRKRIVKQAAKRLSAELRA